jgi:hypothetical protein
MDGYMLMHISNVAKKQIGATWVMAYGLGGLADDVREVVGGGKMGGLSIL